MIPIMSGDRMNTYRVFKGEIEKVEFIAQAEGRDISGVEALVLMYMRKRMNELETKGHGYDNASD